MNAIETLRSLIAAAPMSSTRHSLLTVLARNVDRMHPEVVERLLYQARAEVRSQLSFLAKTGAR